MKKVLIVGRPNVGKSSLFNCLAKKKRALVINQPGVTRDILKQQCSWWGGQFEVWDSGGLLAKGSPLGELINKQVQLAVRHADQILFVVSAHSGLQDEDKTIFKLIKKSGQPFLILVNKVDEIEKAPLLLSDFSCLGESLLPCSFEQGTGIPEIVEWILSQRLLKGTALEKSCAGDKSLKHKGFHQHNLKGTATDKNPSHQQKVQLLLTGPVNVGKSTLSNSLLKQDNSLTSPLPGTTLDVVKECFSYNSYVYSLCDTAGFKGAKKNKMESLSIFKTIQSFKSTDLVLLLLDGTRPANRMSARILNLCVKAHKPLILVVNKWDKVPKEGQTKEGYRKNLQQKFSFYSNLPVVFVSALKSEGLGALMKKVEEVHQKSCFQVSTSELNRFFTKVIRKMPSPVYGTQNVRFYYLTQIQQAPPSFIAFANYPEGVRDSYKRFIIKQIQKQWNLKGVPVRLSVLRK